MKIKYFLMTIVVITLSCGTSPVKAEPAAPKPAAEFSMVPAEERIPEAEDIVIADEDLVDPIEKIPEEPAVLAIEEEIQQDEIIDIEKIIASAIEEIIEPQEEITAPPDFSPFQAPLISSLEQGKWYLQLGAYSRTENVENEIEKLGTSYPVAIQNIGTDEKPLFRVLLGPLSQGESSALLLRFKNIGYKDAFVRRN